MGASAIRARRGRDRRQAQRARHRGGLARRPARPRHLLGRRHPLADRRRRARGARGLPPHHGRLRRRPTSARWRRARCARRATPTCSSTASSGRTGIQFEIINEAEESRLVYLAVRDALRRHAAFKAARDAARRGRRRQHQPDGAPARAADALGRLRARLGPAPPAARPPPAHATNCRWRCSTATSPTSWRKSGVEIPLDRITHVIAIGGDVRFVAAQIADGETDAAGPRDRPRAVPRVLRRDRAARRRQPGRSVPAAAGRSRDAAAGPARLPRAALGDRRPQRGRLERLAARRRAARRRRAEEPAERRGLRAAGAGQRRHARPPLPLRSRARPPRRDAGDAALRRAARGARARRPRTAAAARSRRCCTTSASTSACARITSTRSTSSRRRRSSASPTRRRRSSRTSRATIAADCRRTRTCRSSPSTAPTG